MKFVQMAMMVFIEWCFHTRKVDHACIAMAVLAKIYCNEKVTTEVTTLYQYRSRDLARSRLAALSTFVRSCWTFYFLQEIVSEVYSYIVMTVVRCDRS